MPLGIGGMIAADPVLTQWGMEFRQLATNFVSDRAAPWVQTETDTGAYYIADAINNLRAEDITWSHTTGASRVDSKFTAAAFKAQPYGIEEAVPDAYVRNWRAGGDDLKRRVVNGLTDKIMLAREVRVEAIFDGVAPTTSLSGTARWDSTASNPRADVVTTQVAILKRVGLRGNAVIATGAVWDSMIGTAVGGSAGSVLIDAIKYTRPGLGAELTPELIASYLNIKYFLPGISIQQDPTKHETMTVNAAGLPEAGTYVFDQKEIYGFYVDPNPGPQSLSYLLTFGPEHGTIDQYRDDKVRADIVRCFDTIVEKTTCSNAIYTLGTVIS